MLATHYSLVLKSDYCLLQYEQPCDCSVMYTTSDGVNIWS
jgi:hypothetical protein